MSRLIPIFLTVLFSAMLLIACGADSESKSDADAALTTTTTNDVSAEQAKPPAPQMTLAAYDTNGELRQLSEWIGKKPVVVNFWGTWCGPCRREIPELVKLYGEYREKGIEIVSLALRDTPDKVEAYTAQAGMDWVMLMGDRNLAATYKVSGVPTTFFYDRDGNMVHVPDYNGNMVDRFVGPRNYEVFKAAFESIL